MRIPANRIASSFVCVALAVTLSALGGCGEEECDCAIPEQVALSEAVGQWSTVDSSHYQFVSVRSCECLPDVGRPIIVEVVDGAIANAVYEDDRQPVSQEVRDTLFTVQEMFDLIQAAINEGAVSIDVSYDAERGFPTTINIDYDEAIADEEMYLDIRDFEIIVDVGF